MTIKNRIENAFLKMSFCAALGGSLQANATETIEKYDDNKHKTENKSISEYKNSLSAINLSDKYNENQKVITKSQQKWEDGKLSEMTFEGYDAEYTLGSTKLNINSATSYVNGDVKAYKSSVILHDGQNKIDISKEWDQLDKKTNLQGIDNGQYLEMGKSELKGNQRAYLRFCKEINANKELSKEAKQELQSFAKDFTKTFEVGEKTIAEDYAISDFSEIITIKNASFEK